MAMSDLSKAGIMFKQGLTVASKTTVADLEKACGATFSEDYKEFLENINGARIALKDSEAKSALAAEVRWAGVNYLLHPEREFIRIDYIYDKDTALKVYKNMCRYPVGPVFPLAAADNTTCFVLSLNEHESGYVKALRLFTAGSHTVTGSAIVFTSLTIATSVTDFFLSLKPLKRA